MSGLDDIEALVFDVFGTLFDHDSAVAELEPELGSTAKNVAALWRRKQLEYSWLRSLMGRHADFSTVTEEALEHALEAKGVAARWKGPLMGTYSRLIAFDDVAPTLDALAAAGRRMAVLSNGSPEMLDTVLGDSGLGGHFETAFSAEEAGVFKPHPNVYRLAERGLGLAAAQITLVSSNAWDVAGAAAYGFSAIWINRSGAAPERLPAGPAAMLERLDALPDLLHRQGET